MRVDVCRSQFSTIWYSYNNNHSDTNNAHRQLEHQLIKLGTKGELVLYIDGHPAAEKANTHNKHEQDCHKAHDHAHRALIMLEDCLLTNKCICKHHIMAVNKALKSAFSWTMEDRQAFVDYMAKKGYDIILCDTKVDIKIAADCEEEDVVITGDSDLLIYKSVPAYWLYNKAAVLDALDVTSTQLVVLAIISGNNYTHNILTLGIETNCKLIKKLEDGDETSIIQKYLSLPKVIRKTDKDDANDWTSASFANALKVFVTMKQGRAEMTTPLEDSSDATPTYDALQLRMDEFMTKHKQYQKEAYEARVAKRALQSAQASSAAVSKPSNMFATVDKPSSANASTYCLRYSAKVRYEPTQKHEPPPVLLQYGPKPWNPPSNKPDAPVPQPKKPPASVKPQIHGHLEQKQMLDEMMWEHPMVMLNLGNLKENVKAVVSDSGASQAIIDSIQKAVREASYTKQRGQELIGKYIQAVFYPHPAPGKQHPKDPLAVTNSTDIAILDQLCPQLTSKELAEDDEHHNGVEDGHGEGKKTHFLNTFLTFLYSGNMPMASSSGVAATVNSFICQLQDMDLLPKSDKPKAEIIKNIKDFTPSYLIRSVATQLSAELKWQYKYGCKALSEKMAAMIKKGTLLSKDEIKLNNKVPAIELFLRLNNMTGNKWTIAPLSPVEDGWLTFTEAKLGAFFHKKEAELHPTLKNLIHHTDE
ncbi:hypothetical protein BG006_010449 [Podila minutissima]|uniref:Uncharacterized protein n=1 Tax=Podila minutissima TaxID=64525 RepID=A0A9P5SDP6_9FUNG|nr:hypothetical protein BG006_010449 [Podila minutissima]